MVRSIFLSWFTMIFIKFDKMTRNVYILKAREYNIVDNWREEHK